MLTKYVTPGEKVELNIISSSISNRSDFVKKTYLTQVYDVLSDDSLQILIPIEKGKLILLPMDE